MDVIVITTVVPSGTSKYGGSVTLGDSSDGGTVPLGDGVVVVSADSLGDGGVEVNVSDVVPLG